jgi:hypothetical protein
VLQLPPSLTRHFVDPSGSFDHLALLRTPDERLVSIARQMPPQERAWLYRRLERFRPGFVERMMAQAAGVDLARQRMRFLRVLEKSFEPVPCPEG